MIYNMDELYEIVGQELKRGEERPGLMARAIAETEGDPHKAKSTYIRYRIEQLKANAKSAPLTKQGTEEEALLAEKYREGKRYEENVSDSAEGILELRHPIDVRTDSRSGTKKDPELFSVTEGISNDELKLFIGKRSTKYLHRFRSFKKRKRISFSITWHWPTFLVGFWWMFYRKLYLWGFLEFALTLVPGLCLISRPAFALAANYLMYKRAARTIVSLKAKNPSKDARLLKEAIHRSGGTDPWIPYLAIPLAIIHLVMVAGISFFALFTPRILKYFW